MIGRLALAQLRAHRGSTIWLAGLLTLLAAIVTYIMVTGATQATLTRLQYDATQGTGERGAWVSIAVQGTNKYMDSLTQAVLADAIAAGGDVLVVASEQLLLNPPNELGGWEEGDTINVVAFSDPDHAESLLAEGSLPTARGEVAIAQEYADRTGARVGDTVEFHAIDWYNYAEPPPTRPIPLEVVGILTSDQLSGYDLWGMPGAVVSWAEATEPQGALVLQIRTQDGDAASFADAFVGWDGPSPILDPYLAFGSGNPVGYGISMPMSSAPWLGAAFTLVAAMVVMSFAVGRSQAAARTQWVATTRTLGASRRYVAAATLVETALIAVGALVGGLALGTAAGQAHLSLARAAVAHPFGPATVSWHVAILPVVAGVLALVTVIVSAVPAFWASRVPPAAALKPVNDVTEAELSRRVRVAWLWIPFGAGWAAMWWGEALPYNTGAAFVALGGIAAFVTGFVLVVEWARRLVPFVGRRMARSPRRAIMAAGDALRLRPRQAVAPALIAALGTGVVTWVSVNMATDLARAQTDPLYTGEPASTLLDWAVADTLRSGFVVSLVVATLACQLVIAAIAVSHRAAVTRESGALRALGLSRSDEARAFWWQQWVPQGLGMAIGIVTVQALCAGLEVMGDYPSRVGAVALRGAIGMVPVLAIAAVALVLAGLVAWLVARSTTRTTPVAALRPAH